MAKRKEPVDFWCDDCGRMVDPDSVYKENKNHFHEVVYVHEVQGSDEDGELV